MRCKVLLGTKLLIENKRRNSIGSVENDILVGEQLGFKYIMPTAFYVCMQGLLFAALNAIIKIYRNFTLFMQFCMRV